MTSGAITAIVTLAGTAAVYAIVRAPLARARNPFVRGAGPMLAALGAGPGLILPAFVLFEPRHEGEPLGALLPGLAAAGVALFGLWLHRAFRMMLCSRHIVARWSESGTPMADSRWGMPAVRIDSGAPVVAVAGLWRPLLFIDRRVLDACTPEELDAIAAHERAHVRHYDNLRRLLLGVAAGPQSAFAAAWREAAEWEADRQAATSPRAAVNLAAALVRLSRAAAGHTPDGAIISTILDGGSLESRIGALLALDRDASPTERSRPLAAALSAAAVVAAPFLLPAVHRCVELGVRHLP